MIESPCIKNCCLDNDDICIGCGRTLHEITSWSSMTNDKKQQVLLDSKNRISQRINRNRMNSGKG